MKKFALMLLSAMATAAVAHGGHGLDTSAHWHATDVLGFVIAAALAVAVYFAKK